MSFPTATDEACLSRFCAKGSRWFRRYYQKVFPAGVDNGREHYRNTIALLREHPFAGQPTGEGDFRRLRISQTPFTIGYRVRNGQIEVLRVADQRSNNADKGPEQETEQP
ncbi:type II toxin-antitoxin system RelE/ParE family toxin [Mesorhizobium liriopis]|uniref:type II toxin-antitoxin system RelE/ParE family toxin n=1 Tax=Mesorhizobium liriopis TaxID=2953882 RepID=UPI00338F2607